MTIACGICGADVYEHEDACVRCSWPQGFPNVRIVSSANERAALAARAQAGRQSAEQAGAKAEIDRIGVLVDAAPIAFNRRLDQLYSWCSANDQCFSPWIAEVDKGRRVYPDMFNIGRVAFEHNVNPNYSKRINFGYVKVGNRRLASYGPYTVRFRDNAVSRRATFLEMNAYFFCRHHKVTEPTQMPLGYRSTWDERKLLAEAKLGGKVRAGMSDADLEYLILHDKDDSGEADFLEAHVYTPLHISAIEHVCGPAPEAGHEPIWAFVRSVLTAVGAQVEVSL